MTSFGDTLSLGSSTHRLPYSFPHDAASCHGDDFNVLDHSLAKGHFSACSITSVREAAITPRATWVGHQPCSLSPVAQISTHQHQLALALQMENNTTVNDVGTTEYLPRHFSQCLDNGWGHPQYSGSGEEGVVPIKSVHLGTPNYKVRRPLDMTVQEIAEETTDLSNMEVYGWPLEVVDHSYGQDTGASEYITRSQPIHLGAEGRGSPGEYLQMQHNLQTNTLDNRSDHSRRGGSGIGGEVERDLLGTHIHNDIGQETSMSNIRRTRDDPRDFDLSMDISGQNEGEYDVPLQNESTSFIHSNSQTTGGDSALYETPNVSGVRARQRHLYSRVSEPGEGERVSPQGVGYPQHPRSAPPCTNVVGSGLAPSGGMIDAPHQSKLPRPFHRVQAPDQLGDVHNNRGNETFVRAAGHPPGGVVE